MSASLFHGLSHTDVPVSDLARALALYSGTLGFTERQRGDGWADLDAGSGLVRLVCVRRVERPATLRVLAPDVALAYEALLRAGAVALYEPARTADLELAGAVADADRNTLIVWRALSEDEYASPPELPTSARWQPDAEALLKSLLLSVPALFRGLARRRVVRVAEELAGRASPVGREQVIRGFILSSAKVTRYRTRRPLQEHGVDPDRYAADYDE